MANKDDDKTLPNFKFDLEKASGGWKGPGDQQNNKPSIIFLSHKVLLRLPCA